MTTDYKSTIRLPQTDFAMKAKLPQREPDMLARWLEAGLHERINESTQGRPVWIHHDGPPYANGNMHMGHAFERSLKDIVTRSHRMLGKHVPCVPGWDCHGLPIEWKIEEKYRKAGKDKDEVPIVEFRRECREFAQHWVDVQREELKRLGIETDWENPYITMDFNAEARIAEELLKFVMNGGLYKGAKPVMWSVVEQTALAEAEVEYHDHDSRQIDVRFPVINASIEPLEGAKVVIWTTTPWTIPGNRAVAYGAAMDYAVIEVTETDGVGHATVGEKLVFAEALLVEACGRAGITGHAVLAQFKGDALAGTVCAHPWRGKGYDFDVPLLAGDHVTTEAGTGFVHTAPSHGQEDYEVWLTHGHRDIPDMVAGDGKYYDHVPMFAGLHVFKADGPVCDALDSVGALLSAGDLRHSYPHSWRSKAPLIFRNTPQWFISMDTNDLRDTALAEIDRVRWIPETGQNRIRAMVETRPDWVVSRQRAWGVPITVFVNKRTGELLRDNAVNQRIVNTFRDRGADVWFEEDNAFFLGNEHDPDEWDKVTDILDVWFDSGCTHAFVLEDRPELSSPASLYLEGSDQHRGWFQSSLLESVGTRGRAPYEAVLTHGFVLDAKGRKMSKSLGNTVEPQKIIDQYGADILRLWAASTDYVNDVRIGNDIIASQVDAYRKIRNTLRFAIGNLNDFGDAERLPVDQMPELERFVLHRLWEIDGMMRHAIEDYEFHRIYQALYNFCIVDLSALFFDIRKDALYCDAPDATRRRAARTVLAEVYDCLTAWLAPILVFTAEEAWLARNPGDGESVHLRTFPDVPAEWRDDELAEKWVTLRSLRRVITGALEVERREKRIGSSLAAAPIVYVTDEAYATALDGIDLAEFAITSAATLLQAPIPEDAFTLDEVPGIGVVPVAADGEKCQRCWMILPEVGEDPDHPDLCNRCSQAVATA
ncbi:MAG: isoleucine--tRNA ligase [Alphaproteobacteria bacterium]